jgi:hypothetical protein
MRLAIREDFDDNPAIEALRRRLRGVLLWLLTLTAVWIELTVTMVFYWSVRATGPAAHRYFFRWFIAWFLTQVVALTFASLPYHGRQYPVIRVYRFLNHRFYLDASFGAWFWNCAPAGAALTLAIVLACLLGLHAWDRVRHPDRPRGLTLLWLKTSADELRAAFWLAHRRRRARDLPENFMHTRRTAVGRPHRKRI